jgi:pilus assembly protein Flp/PilA
MRHRGGEDVKQVKSEGKGGKAIRYLIGIWENVKSKFQNEEGQGLVEYALLLALIAVFCVGVLVSLGERVSNTFDSIRDQLPTT